MSGIILIGNLKRFVEVKNTLNEYNSLVYLHKGRTLILRQIRKMELPFFKDLLDGCGQCLSPVRVCGNEREWKDRLKLKVVYYAGMKDRLDDYRNEDFVADLVLEAKEDLAVIRGYVTRVVLLQDYLKEA